jgi:hypothetical protein
MDDLVWDRKTRSYMGTCKQRKLDEVRMESALSFYLREHPQEQEAESFMGAMQQCFAALSYYDRERLGVR